MFNQADSRAVQPTRLNLTFAKSETAFAIRIGRLLLVLVTLACGAVHGEEMRAQRDAFLKAEAALNSGNSAEYSRLLKRLERYPLRVYLRYQELYNSLRGPEVIGFLDRYPKTRYAKLLRKKYLWHLANSGRWQEFVKLYRDEDNVALQCAYRQALYHIGRRTEALEGARDLWLSGDSRPDACDALFDELRKSSLFSPDLAWQRFALALEKGNRGLAKYLTRTLAAKDLEPARRALQVDADPERIAPCPPPAGGVRDAWIFAHAIERRAENDLIGAILLWDARHADYGLDAQTRHRVNRHLAMLAALRRYPFAYARFERLDPALRDQDARFWQIRSALTGKNWDRVADAIENLPKEEQAQIKWKYWLARALTARGTRDRAELLFLEVAKERDYYGFLAADRMNLDYRFDERPIDLDPQERARLEAMPQFAAIKELIALNREVEARRNWWHMLEGLSKPQKALAAKIAEGWGMDQLAVFTAARAEHWDDLRLRFPIRFTSPIVRTSKEHGLAPAMVFGLIRQESVFDDRVVSGAGAIGLMQVMPATGRQIAREISEPWHSNRSLFDPETNLRYGTYYLRNLLDRFDRNLALAAAGYNAGPHRVESWLPARDALESDLWVEIIPYRETRRYVRYVLGYTIIYQHRLQSARSRLRDYMPMVAAGNPTPKGDLPAQKNNSCR